MWYGYPTKPRLSILLKSKKKLNNKRSHVFGERLNFKNSSPRLTSKLFVPQPWNLIVMTPLESRLKYYSFYLYDKTYFYNITTPLGLRAAWFDSTTNMLILYHNASSYCYYSILNSIQATLMLFTKPFFVKIRFRGKGYYMYKNSRQTIAPQFGYAHRVYIYAQANSVKFLSKTKILLFGLSKSEILKTAYSLSTVKPMNIFTGRGVRFARQIVYRKVGKVSSYR